MKRYLCVLIVLPLLLVASSCGEENESREAANGQVTAESPELFQQAAFQADSALALARVRFPEARLLGGELEMEGGKLVYSLDLGIEDQEGVTEVWVDAHTGEIVSVEHEQESPPSYEFIAQISVGGDVASWDYLSEDVAARRLYVSNGTRVVVISMDGDSVVGEIPDLPGVHGFAVAHDLGRGFASDGRENKVAVVDLNTLEVIQRVDTGENPDGILYVPDFGEVYAFNGTGHSATVIAAATGEVVATIPLSGKPEFAVFDPGANRIYNNIEDQNEIAVIDPVAHEVVETWSISPGEAASGLAIDLAHHRLFAVCENEMMVMLNSQTGEVVTTVPIGSGTDAARFDPSTQLAFSSNGEGTVTISHEVSPSELTVVQTLETATGARTMTLDPTTHRIYLSTADFEAANPADSTARRRRGPMVPGSFRVLVYGPGS